MALFSKENLENIKQGTINTVKKSKQNCPACNSEISNDSNFCPNCGFKLNESNDENGEKDNDEKKKDEFYNAPYIHESDRKALKALKAIPGFATIMKKFIKVFNEKEYRILNLSSNIRIDENQMPEIYNMLPPICEKLGIDIPEIYLELDVVPNAYTYGDTKPFIVITSGLLETMPMDLLPIVIAHECGHIACHHTLYTTIANLLISGANSVASYFGLGGVLSLPLQVALYHWERCSELSADRAAALYDGTDKNIIEMCMRFAGYDKDLNLTASKDLFMKQADDYLEMINASKWDKTLEFLVLVNQTHPFNAVRASECKKWVESEEFKSLS